MVKNAMNSGQARSIKLTGDKLRKYFAIQCTDDKGMIRNEYLSGLVNKDSVGSYILKSGNNWQFHLGSLQPFIEKWGVSILNDGKQIDYRISPNEIIIDITSNGFLNSFMLKGNFFVVHDSPNWIIFSAFDILNFMQNSELVRWRILESGRIKGDVFFENKYNSVLTIEYRAEKHKRQFVFGAHGGGSGIKFKKYLKMNLIYNEIPINHGLWK